MTGMHENTTLVACGKPPFYYRNILGNMVDWVIFLVGLPEVSIACYALLCLLKKEKAAPIFSLNLLLSDLIQIGITIVFIVSRLFHSTFQPVITAFFCITEQFVRFGLTTSLGFKNTDPAWHNY